MSCGRAASSTSNQPRTCVSATSTGTSSDGPGARDESGRANTGGSTAMNEYGATLVTGITNGMTYGLLGVTFALIFFVTGRFHFAYGLFYGLAGVLAAWGVEVQGWGIAPAVVIGVLAAVVGGVLCEVVVYRAFDKRAPGLSLLGIFIAS